MFHVYDVNEDETKSPLFLCRISSKVSTDAEHVEEDEGRSIHHLETDDFHPDGPSGFQLPKYTKQKGDDTHNKNVFAFEPEKKRYHQYVGVLEVLPCNHRAISIEEASAICVGGWGLCPDRKAYDSRQNSTAPQNKAEICNLQACCMITSLASSTLSPPYRTRSCMSFTAWSAVCNQVCDKTFRRCTTPSLLSIWCSRSCREITTLLPLGLLLGRFASTGESAVLQKHVFSHDWQGWVVGLSKYPPSCFRLWLWEDCQWEIATLVYCHTKNLILWSCI